MNQVTRTPNALKHGVFSKTLFLFKEDPAQFEELHQELCQEWQPVGLSEQDCILHLAILYFRKRRVPLLLHCQREKSKKQPADPILSGLLEGDPYPFYEDSVEAYRATITDGRRGSQVQPALDPLIQRVSDLLGLSRSLYGETNLKWIDFSLKMGAPQDAEYLIANVRRAEFSDGREYLVALKKTVDTVLLPAARQELRDQVGTTEDDLMRGLQLMPPDAIEAELDFLDRIDHMIERQLSKFGRIRAMKNIGLDRATRKSNSAPPRLIEHQQTSEGTIDHQT